MRYIFYKRVMDHIVHRRGNNNMHKLNFDYSCMSVKELRIKAESLF